MTKLVGILNFTPDSMSDGNKFFTVDSALVRIRDLFRQGADIVDIGGTSTSYNKRLLTPEEEWARISPSLITMSCYENISLDSFNYENIVKAVELGISWINDVSCGKNEKTLEFIAANPHVNYILMLSLVLPANANIRIKNIDDLYLLAKERIDCCLKYGIKRDQIIFDPGIGFVTNPEQSFEVIKKIDYYKTLDVPIYIGHSRKSFFNFINHSIPPEERDLETVIASLYMILKKVDYLRVHNIQMHKRAINIFNKLIN